MVLWIPEFSSLWADDVQQRPPCVTKLVTSITELLLISLDFQFSRTMSKVQRRWSREEDALLREETDLQLAGELPDQYRQTRPCHVNIAVVIKPMLVKLRTGTKLLKRYREGIIRIVVNASSLRFRAD